MQRTLLIQLLLLLIKACTCCLAATHLPHVAPDLGHSLSHGRAGSAHAAHATHASHAHALPLSVPSVPLPHPDAHPSSAAPSRRILSSSSAALHASFPPLLEPCNSVAQQIGRHALDALGHELQVLQRHVRVLFDLEALFGARTAGPPADAKEQYVWNHTWDTDLSLEELKERKEQEGKVVSSMQSKVQALLDNTLKLLPSDLSSTVSQARLSACAMSRLSPRLFPDRPEISFMLQYFRRPWLLEGLVSSIQQCAASSGVAAELLVNVDSPDEHEQWAELAHGTKGFVVPVFSNNVHEARGYNRLAGMARGRILVVLQDDEMLGSECGWLRNLITAFDRFPLVGVVGLKSFVWAFGPNNTQEGVYFRDPATKLEMQFVLDADYAPMAIRRSALLHVGGIDETMSEPGECGIFGDWELCTRMWMAGFQVMYMPQPQKTHDTSHDSGTHRPETGERCWGRQGRLASSLYWHRYGDWDQPVLVGLAQRAKELNIQHLEVLDRPNRQPGGAGELIPWGGPCPFATGCEEFATSAGPAQRRLPPEGATGS